ncbi:MAG: hypothetical protein U5L09_21095 [Bacteroidales bacterium]|nr:hypothetical protein [Bacteroidales bacterium]
MDLQYLKFQLKFKKVIAITLAWQIIAILNILYMFGYITSITSTELPYSLSQSLLYSFIAASLGGFVFGGAEVFYLRNLLRKKPLGIVLLSKSIIYFSMLFVVYFISISLYFKMNMRHPFSINQFYFNPGNIFRSLIFCLNLLFGCSYDWHLHLFGD